MASNRHAVFVDPGYLNARINTRDQWHAVAVTWERRIVETGRQLLTTEFVLTEFADSLATVRFRELASASIAILQSSATIEIVPASSSLFDAGLELFSQRPDKHWGLTDCTSFVVMSERAMIDALANDIHFRQAGFVPLLLDDR